MKAGDLVRHKKGGLYEIRARGVTDHALQEGLTVALADGDWADLRVRARITDSLEANSPYVLYRSLESGESFVRPAALFDEPGRFTLLTGRKGYRGENCNRGACQRPGAVWWNTSTRSWYCQACAEKINYWSQKDDKTTLCFLMPEEFAP